MRFRYHLLKQQRNMIRTENDKCFLCDCNESKKKNSHIVPAFMLNNIVGVRNNEHSFILTNEDQKLVDEFYGRKYNQDRIQEKMTENFTKDFILCDKCENYFGKLESLSKPILDDDKLKLQNNKVVLLNDINYIVIAKINYSLLRLFFYSIIWRLIINEKVNNDFLIQPVEELEKELKIILSQFKEKTEKELKEISFADNLYIQLITTDFQHFQIGQYFNNNSANPFFFICARFIVILIKPTDNENIKNQIEILKPTLNYSNEIIKIVYLPKDTYDLTVNHIFREYLNGLSIEKKRKLFKNTNYLMQFIDIQKYTK
jgi:hypothetical protein